MFPTENRLKNMLGSMNMFTSSGYFPDGRPLARSDLGLPDMQFGMQVHRFIIYNELINKLSPFWLRENV